MCFNASIHVSPDHCIRRWLLYVIIISAASAAVTVVAVFLTEGCSTILMLLLLLLLLIACITLVVINNTPVAMQRHSRCNAKCKLYSKIIISCCHESNAIQNDMQSCVQYWSIEGKHAASWSKISNSSNCVRRNRTIVSRIIYENININIVYNNVVNNINSQNITQTKVCYAYFCLRAHIIKYYFAVPCFRDKGEDEVYFWLLFILLTANGYQ